MSRWPVPCACQRSCTSRGVLRSCRNAGPSLSVRHYHKAQRLWDTWTACDWWLLVRLISIESRKGMIYCLLDPHWAGLRALLHQSVGWVPCLRPSVLFLKDRWYSSAAPPYLQILNIFLCRLIEKYSINIFRRSVINNIWIEKIGHPATVLKKGCPFFTFTAVKLECASKNSFVLI